MKTGEYLTAQRPVKAPKPQKRPPSGSKTPVTPLPGPGKGPKAHIEPRPSGKPKPKPKGLTVTRSDSVKAVAAASAAAKAGGAKGKPGKRIGGTKFSGLTPPGQFEKKGKGLG